jgi:hypothetical protein
MAFGLAGARQDLALGEPRDIFERQWKWVSEMGVTRRLPRDLAPCNAPTS